MRITNNEIEKFRLNFSNRSTVQEYTGILYRLRNFKTQLFSTVRPTVHTNPSRNAAFRKRSSKRRKLETPAFHFKKRSFSKKITTNP